LRVLRYVYFNLLSLAEGMGQRAESMGQRAEGMGQRAEGMG